MVLKVPAQAVSDIVTPYGDLFYYIRSGKSYRDIVHEVKGVTSDILYDCISKLAQSKDAEWQLNRDEVRLFDGFSNSQITEVALKSFYEPERAISLWEISSLSNIPMDVFMSTAPLDKQTRLKLLTTQTIMQRHNMFYNGLTTNCVIDYGLMDPFKLVGYENYTVSNNRVSLK